MEKRYLIDTYAVLKYLNGSFPAAGLDLMDDIVDEESLISFITEIELLMWNPPMPEELNVYLNFVANSTVLHIDSPTVQRAIEFIKRFDLLIPEAIIAATAVRNNLTLLSTKDTVFVKIPILKYINPMYL